MPSVAVFTSDSSTSSDDDGGVLKVKVRVLPALGKRRPQILRETCLRQSKAVEEEPIRIAHPGKPTSSMARAATHSFAANTLNSNVTHRPRCVNFGKNRWKSGHRIIGPSGDFGFWILGIGFVICDWRHGPSALALAPLVAATPGCPTPCAQPQDARIDGCRGRKRRTAKGSDE